MLEKGPGQETVEWLTPSRVENSDGCSDMPALVCLSNLEEAFSNCNNKLNIEDWLSDSLANNLFCTTSENLINSTTFDTRELNNRVGCLPKPLK